MKYICPNCGYEYTIVAYVEIDEEDLKCPKCDERMVPDEAMSRVED